MRNVYLDNASTTPVHKEVVKAMNETMLVNYGNPNSPHALGEKALELINKARREIAQEINARPEEIIFTSGATEANNLALFGIENKLKKKKILISSFEHASVYESCNELRKKGFEVIEIPVDKNGILDLIFLEKHANSAGLVSIIHGHNELGVLQNIDEIARICKREKMLFHIDAVQSFGKVKIDVKNGIDMLSASAHKINGPKGIGFLYVRNGIELDKMSYGGSQEKNRRAGTENVAGIIGLAKALELTRKYNWDKVEKLRNWFMIELEKMGGKINGSKVQRLPGHVHVSLVGLDAEQAIITLSEKGIYCSARSACMSKQHGDNRVLRAIGLNIEEMNGSLRFVISPQTSKDDLKYTLKILREAIR